MKLEDVIFVPVDIVEQIHANALESGGLAGLIDRSLLISAVESPKATFDGRPLYPSLAEMAATYAWGIARNHPFVDGNKRTAFLVALTFLAMNGRTTQVGPEWVDIMVRVASDHAFQRADLVAELLRSMGNDEPVA